MRPNQQQIEVIEDLLGSATQYRETYEELYDHILSALEAVPDDISFDDALYHIMEHELGGKPGISKIEAKYKKAAIRDIAKRYLTYFGHYLISPYMAAVVALTVMLYWLIQTSRIEMSWIVTLCTALNIIPTIARKIFIVRARHMGTYGKSSIIKIYYPYLRMLPVFLFLAFTFTYFISTYFVSPFANSVVYIILAVFFLNLVNILTICRLCKDEFKSITTN